MQMCSAGENASPDNCISRIDDVKTTKTNNILNDLARRRFLSCSHFFVGRIANQTEKSIQIAIFAWYRNAAPKYRSSIYLGNG